MEIEARVEGLREVEMEENGQTFPPIYLTFIKKTKRVGVGMKMYSETTISR